MPGPSTVLIARGRPVVAFIADLTKHSAVGTLTEESEIDVRAPSSVLEQLDGLEKLYRERLPYVEETLTPRVVRVVNDITTIQLATSNYARFLAAAEIFSAYSTNEQQHEFSRYSIGTPPWLAHSFGVNCSLETADGKLMWTLRPQSSAVEGNLFAQVMGEGARPDDIIDGIWIPETTARRGFHEELGFPLDSTGSLSITFDAAVAQFGNGGLSVAGHAVTTLTLQEVIEQHYDAIDSREHTNGLFACDANAEAFNAFMEAHPLNEWCTWGTAVIWNLTTKRLHMKLDDLELQPLKSEIISS